MAQTQSFDTRLRALLRRTRWRAVRHGSLLLLAVGLNALVAAVWVSGGPIGLEGSLAWGLSLSVAAVWGALAWVCLGIPLRALRRPRDLVRIVEEKGRFGNLLVAAEEAGRLPGRWLRTDPVAEELRRRLLVRADAALEVVAPQHILDLRFSGWGWTGLACGLFLLGTLGLLRPGETARGLDRLGQPWAAVAREPQGGIYGERGPGWVVAGGKATLAARDFGGGQDAAVCEIRIGSGMWQAVEARPEPVFAQAGLPAAYRRWVAEVMDVREDFSWRFRRGSRVADPLRVAVRHHPQVIELAATVRPPAYTRSGAQDWPVLPSFLEVPAGSAVDLRGRLNHPVRAAWLVTDPPDSVVLALDSLRIEGTLPVERSLAFTVALEDQAGLGALAPLRYELAAVPDAPPVVRLERPDDDGVLPLSGRVTLMVEAADDYGLAEVSLAARVVAPETDAGAGDGDGGGWGGLPFWPGPAAQDLSFALPGGQLRLSLRPQATGGDLLTRFDLELQTGRLDLQAGDVLEFVAEARDNKRPAPAGVARSRVLRLAVPSAGNVLAEQIQANQDRESELQEMRRRARELAADLDRLTRELMKNPVPDWNRQQEVEAAIERQKALQEELARIAEQLRQELDNLASGQLTSGRQLDKADEVAELLGRQNDGQTEDPLAGMQAGQSGVPPEEAARTIQEVERNQQQLARKLDAALAMLERMSREQELEGLTALMEKLMQKQQDLTEASRALAEKKDSGRQPGADQEAAQDLAAEQETLARDLQDLEEKLQQALDSLSEDQAAGDSQPESEALQEDLAQAMEQLQKQLQEGRMKEAGQQLEQLDPEQAARLQEQALRDLGSLYHILLQTQEAMQMAMQQNQSASLRRLAADLLALSTRQEEIAAKIPEQMREVGSFELTRGEHRLQKATIGVREQLTQLTADAPTRILRLLEKLDDLVQMMGNSVLALQENRGPAGRHYAREALAGANTIVIGLLTEAQVASSGGGGGSQPSAADRLMQMIKEQAGLNGLTEQLRRMLADRGLSQQTRAQMQRLGEAQGGLAGKMEDLAEQERRQPEGERLLGDLAEMGRDMEIVRREIDGGLVSEQTLIRQERILSRMLDARNSVRQRDFSTRRESRTADALFQPRPDVPGAFAPEDSSGRFRLGFQPLQEAPQAYREMVRRYFAALDSLRRLDEGLPSLPPADAGEGDLP